MSKPSCTLRLLVGILLSVMWGGFASAQSTLGGITGVVTDAQGGVIVGA